MRIKLIGWVHFSETSLPQCLFHTSKPDVEYLSKMNVCFLKSKILLVPYTFVSNTFVLSNLSSAGTGLG